MSFSLVLVMPAYNEEECIEQVVSAWHSTLQKQVGTNFRIIVVNDGSKDQTGKILDALQKKLETLVPIHQVNGGHGTAVIRGYEEAIRLGAEWVFQTDSDDQFVAEEFLTFWNARSTSRFLLGNREKRHDPLHRLIITRILRGILALRFGVSIADSNIPFRLIRADYLKNLLARLPGPVFAPNIFLSVCAAADGENMHHFPVTHHERKTGKVSILRWKLLKVCLRSFKELLTFQPRHHST